MLGLYNRKRMKRPQSASPLLWSFNTSHYDVPKRGELMTSNLTWRQRDRMCWDNHYSKVENYRERYYKSQSDIAKLQRLITQKESEARILRIRIAANESKLRRLEQEHAKETCNLMQKISDMELQLQWEVRHMLHRANQDNSMLVKENQDLKERNHSLANEVGRLNRNRTFEMEKLEQQVFESEMEIRRLKTKNTIKEEEIRKIEKQNKTLIDTVQKLKEEKNSTNPTKTSYENREMFITYERRQLQERISILMTEKQRLQEDLAAMSNDRSDFQSKCMTAGIEVQELQLEIQQLQKSIAEKERKNVELARTNHMAVVERENVMKINKQQERDLNSLKEKVRLLEQERSTFTEWSRSTDTEKELDQLRVQTRDMEQELVRQRESKRLNDTEKELNQLRVKVKNMEEEKSSLTKRLNMYDAAEKDLQAKVIKMEGERAQQLKRSTNELDCLQAKVKKLEEEKARLVCQGNRSDETEKELSRLQHKIKYMEEQRHLNLFDISDKEQLKAKLNEKETENISLKQKLNMSYDSEKKVDELQATLEKKEEEKKKLERQLGKLNEKEREIDELGISIKILEKENVRLREEQSNRSNYTEKGLNKLQEKIKDLQEENENLRETTSTMMALKGNNLKLTTENTQLQTAHAVLVKEKSDLESRNSHAEEELRRNVMEIVNKKAEIQELQTKVRDLQMNSNKTEKELSAIKRQKDCLEEELSKLSNENNDLRKEAVEVSRQKEDALERLSRLAGAKLTHGNAAITDLSDTDRPTKIAEKFSELYDNAWTDAFEELDITYHDEKQTINVLLKLLQEAYSFCVKTERDYEDRIRRAVFTLADEREISSTDVAVQKALADLRISLGNECCSIIEEMYLSRLPSILRDIDVAACPKTKEYARQCASLCWRMRIREPPVFIRFEFRQGTSFNSDVLRKFTKTGGYLEFLVWPALYLHENGPLLAKGVAQPKLAP